MGYGRTEVWGFVIRCLDCTRHARTEGSQWITWWLLAVFDLDESLGMTREVFRLLYGVLSVILGGKTGVFGVEKWEERLFDYIQNKSIKAQLHIHDNTSIQIQLYYV